MPAFVLLCRDRKDAADLRARLRPAHLDYLEAHFEEVWLAGPLLSDEGSPIGSVVIIDAEDARGARNFAQACERQGVERLVYLGGLGEGKSEHLRSRQAQWFRRAIGRLQAHVRRRPGFRSAHGPGSAHGCRGFPRRY